MIAENKKDSKNFGANNYVINLEVQELQNAKLKPPALAGGFNLKISMPIYYC